MADDNNSANDVLIERAPSAEIVNPVAPRSATSGNLKVVGLTVLGCLLLAGQCATAYMLLSQRQHLTSLEEGTDTLRRQLSSTGPAGPARVMQVPIGMPLLRTRLEQEEKAPPARRTPLVKLLSATKTETDPTPAGASELDTKCRLEAEGVGQIWPGGFRPQCDEQGHFRPMQCWTGTGYCWCVDQSGKEIPNTRTRFAHPSCQ